MSISRKGWDEIDYLMGFEYKHTLTPNSVGFRLFGGETFEEGQYVVKVGILSIIESAQVAINQSINQQHPKINFFNSPTLQFWPFPDSSIQLPAQERELPFASTTQRIHYIYTSRHFCIFYATPAILPCKLIQMTSVCPPPPKAGPSPGTAYPHLLLPTYLG